jgi:hypothetical protein
MHSLHDSNKITNAWEVLQQKMGISLVFLCFSDVGFDLVVCVIDLMLHLSAANCAISKSLDAFLKVT